jgi:NADH-quinone oxidoreductase subunit L
MGITAATLTAFYMYRSYFMTFTGEYRGNETPIADPYPSDTARAKKLFVPEPVRGPTPEMIHALAAHGHGAHHASEHADHGHGHDAHGHDDHGHGDHHGHGGTPHESPWTMTVPLWVLGTASLFIGVFVGFPPVVSSLLGLHWVPALEQWLHPALAPGMAMAEHYDQVRANVSWLADEHTKHLYEYALATLSVIVALAGFLGARWFYKDAKNPLPERLLNDPESVFAKVPQLALGVRQLHRLIYNKYFVDEVYYSIFVVGGKYLWNGLRNFDVYVVDGIVNGAAFVGRVFGYIQGAIDKYLVDGAVNLVADAVMASGQQLRKLQTGQIRTYLLGAFGGAVAAFMLLLAFMG